MKKRILSVILTVLLVMPWTLFSLAVSAIEENFDTAVNNGEQCVSHNYEENICVICGYHEKHDYNKFSVLSVNTITIECIADGLCSQPQQSLTITPPANPVYNGSAQGVTVDGDYEGDWVVEYSGYSIVGEPFSGQVPPINVGYYDATLVAGDASIKVSYKIEKASPENVSFTYTPSGVYTGQVHNPLATITYDGITLQPFTHFNITYDRPPIDVGNYKMILKGTGNYGFTYELDYTITPAKVTVSAKDNTKVYGKDDPELTYEVNGLLQDDQIYVNLTREEGEDVGGYKILLDDYLLNDNYEVVFVGGVFTITKAPLTVTAKNYEIYYGQPIPQLECTVDGLILGDSINVELNLEPGTIGKLKINSSVSAGKNYSVNYVEGYVNIIPDLRFLNLLSFENLKSMHKSALEYAIDVLELNQEVKNEYINEYNLCKAYIQYIQQTQAELWEIESESQKYKVETITRFDKNAVDDLISRRDALLGSDNLTDSEKDSLRNATSHLVAVEERLVYLNTPLGLRGDIDNSGQIDSRDYIRVKRAYFKTAKLDESVVAFADINDNGQIDARDYVQLKRVYFKTAVIKEDIKYIFPQ